MPSLYYFSRLSQSSSIDQLLDSNVPDSTGLTGKIYPSGKVSVGRVPPKQILRADENYESSRTHYTCYRKSHYHYEQGVVHEYSWVPGVAPKLGLASVPNCHKLGNKRYGLKGISPRGRTSVREGAFLLERRYGRRVGFYTLTCPYTDLNSIYSYNKNISYIQKTYFQELKREYERQGLVWSYVSVLEIQTERFDDTGIPVLHIHYLAPCYLPGTTSWICTADTIRALWARVLQNACGGAPDTSPSVDASVVHSSAVGYISKYMSKGGASISFVAEVCPDQLPGQWWSMSSNVRVCLKKSIVILPDTVASVFFYGANEDPNSPFYLYYRRDVYACIRGENKKVGISGNMKSSQVCIFQDISAWKKEYNDL